MNSDEKAIASRSIIHFSMYPFIVSDVKTCFYVDDALKKKIQGKVVSKFRHTQQNCSGIYDHAFKRNSAFDLVKMV